MTKEDKQGYLCCVQFQNVFLPEPSQKILPSAYGTMFHVSKCFMNYRKECKNMIKEEKNRKNDKAKSVEIIAQMICNMVSPLILDRYH